VARPQRSVPRYCPYGECHQLGVLRHALRAFKLQQHDNSTGFELGLRGARRMVALSEDRLNVSNEGRVVGDVCDPAAGWDTELAAFDDA